MSRIYEALQKAETERAPGSAAKTDENGTLRTRDISLDLQRAKDRSAGGRFTRAEERAAAVDPPLSRYSESERARVESDIDLEGVPEMVWTPAFDRLPSLLDRGPSVEQFRSLRSRLHELRDKRPLKTILVTSGLPQEGKSFISSNLAISLARNRHARVLLIDGDMRRYTVHKMLGCKAEPGLADFLAGRARIADVLQRPDTARSTGMVQGVTARLPALTVISGGNGGDNAADLSNNHRWSQLLQAVAPIFDWIVIDTSPVLPVSDAVNLSRSCDGVLLVARSGVTEYGNLQRTQAELKSAHLLGVVLNGAAALKGSDDYYGYNSYAAAVPDESAVFEDK